MFSFSMEMGLNIRDNFFFSCFFVVLFVGFLDFLLRKRFNKPQLIFSLMDVVL